MAKYNSIELRKSFDENVVSALNEISGIVYELEYTDQNNSDVIRYWWCAFDTNSRMLGFLLIEPHSYYQFAMTTRLLLEISTDLAFISNNRCNIPLLNKAQQEIQRKQQDNSTYSHRSAAKDAVDKFHLQTEIVGKNVKTEARIELVEDREILADLYAELCAASHFNHMQTIWEGNKKTEKEYFKNLAYLLAFYPLFFNMTIKAIGEITEDTSLLGYDNKKMENALDQLG